MLSQSSIFSSEKELLHKIAGGDETAFKYLYEKYSDRIYSLSVILTHSEYMAEEIIQDVFCILWKNRRELPEIDYINSYIRKVTANVACNYLRRLTTEKIILRSILNETSQISESCEHSVINSEIQKIVEKAICNLPPQQRRVYILSRHQGLKQEEVAKRMGISVYTVKEYMKYAVISIRKFVQNHIELSIILSAHLFSQN
ncbi:MAG: RNA polymerase sigma factor [Bacteroidales bacterium]